ncbi:MAG: NifB/NifX family molybdenum-iron cluster-binding protein [Dehalococcoidia bacterium]
MKIVVSAMGATLDSEVDPRFGRCRYLIYIDPDTMDFEAHDNAASGAGGGAGIATGQAVLDKGVEAVLTGNLGPNAHMVLSQAGIRVITGVSGTVREAVEMFKQGGMAETSSPTVKAHAGMGGGMTGRRSSRSSAGTSANPPVSGTAGDLSGELETLKGRANTLKQQLDNLMLRLEELENKSK